jgi:hypothetical protein
MPVKRHRAANGGCQTTNQSGTPCAAPPTRDSHYCSLHKLAALPSERYIR